MFIKWIPQILSIFDFHKPCFLDKLLILATEYPAAMFYSFHLSHDQNRQHYPSYINRQTVGRILQLLHNPLAEQFMLGLQCICVPNSMIMTQLSLLEKMLDFQDDLSYLAFTAAVNNCLRILYGNTNDDDAFDVNNQKGAIFEEIRPFKQQIRALIDTYGMQANMQFLYSIIIIIRYIRSV